jgi:hypothetical protein
MPRSFVVLEQPLKRISRPAQKPVRQLLGAQAVILAASAVLLPYRLSSDAQLGGQLFSAQRGAGVVGSRGFGGAHIAVLFVNDRNNDIQPDGMAKIWRKSGGKLAEIWRKLATPA